MDDHGIAFDRLAARKALRLSLGTIFIGEDSPIDPARKRPNLPELHALQVMFLCAFHENVGYVSVHRPLRDPKDRKSLQPSKVRLGSKNSRSAFTALSLNA